MSSKHPLQGKRLLISGGGGYLGSNLISRLQDVDCRIVRLGRFEAENLPEDSTRLSHCVGDVRDREVWEKALSGIDFVFHFAAQTSVYVANEDPFADLQSNVMPMLHLLEVCRERDWKTTVLFSGTVTQAGVPKQLPVDETHPDRPITVYDTHKLMAETYLKLFTRLGIVRGAVLRLANVYGPGPKSSQPDRGILNQIVGKALRGESLHIYGQGRYQRDYVYVDDVSSAFVADTGRFTQATGWKPEVSLAEGIDRTIEALQESLCT